MGLSLGVMGGSVLAMGATVATTKNETAKQPSQASSESSKATSWKGNFLFNGKPVNADVELAKLTGLSLGERRNYKQAMAKKTTTAQNILKGAIDKNKERVNIETKSEQVGTRASADEISFTTVGSGTSMHTMTPNFYFGEYPTGKYSTTLSAEWPYEGSSGLLSVTVPADYQGPAPSVTMSTDPAGFRDKNNSKLQGTIEVPQSNAPTDTTNVQITSGGSRKLNLKPDSNNHYTYNLGNTGLYVFSTSNTEVGRYSLNITYTINSNAEAGSQM